MTDETRKLMKRTFVTVAYGDIMAAQYGRLYEIMPTNEWRRCKDYAKELGISQQKVRMFFEKMARIGKAQRRTHTETVKFEGYGFISDCKEPALIDAYDKDGDFLGKVSNPRFVDTGHWGETEITKEVTIAEWCFTPLA